MKKILKGASSSRINFRRDQTQTYQTLDPSRMHLLDFPQQLLHNILLFVACNSFRDLHKAKVACKTFKNVIEEEVFLKKWMFSMGDHEWYLPIPHLTEFRLLCLELGNPSTIFIRDLWDYFCYDNLEEGLEAIRIAAEKGYDVTKYTSAMIWRIMNHHSLSDSPLINNLSMNFYAQTRRNVNEAGNGFSWGVEAPPLFEEKIDLMRTGCIHNLTKLQLLNDNYVFKWVDEAFLNEIDSLKFKNAKIEQELKEIITKNNKRFEKVRSKLKKEIMERAEDVLIEAKSRMKMI